VAKFEDFGFGFSFAFYRSLFYLVSTFI